jgi:hypothetical protein
MTPTRQKFARTILDAISYHSQLEEDIQELFDGTWEEQKAKNYDSTFDHIGFDTYDSSIELYVRDDAVFDTDALMNLLNESGFYYGWINFDDGTEIHFGSHGCGARTLKEYPHWTKERAEQSNSARLDHFLRLSRPVLRRLITKSHEASAADSVGRASTQGAALLTEDSVPAPLAVGPVAEEEKEGKCS